MRHAPIRDLIGLIIAILCLAVMSTQAQANPVKAKPAKVSQITKERLVLMPLRLGEADMSRQAAMEIALLEGLQQKYEVFSGEQVAKKAREIFNKESRNTAHKECDETRCLQDIAESFQAELLAVASVSRQEDGYFLALSIQNIFDNKVVYSKSTPCKNCDAYQAVERLKELSGAPVAATPPVPEVAYVPDTPFVSAKAPDTENAQWVEVQKGNSIEDYEAYLSQYPKGKFVVPAKGKIKKLKDQEAGNAKREQEQATVELTLQDQSAWESANSTATEASYRSYLNNYPQGSYANLATARIAKLKKETTQAVAPSAKTGKVFKECANCPSMVIIPAGSF